MPTTIVSSIAMPVSVITTMTPKHAFGPSETGQDQVPYDLSPQIATTFGTANDKRVSLLVCLKSVLGVSRLLGFFPFRFITHEVDGKVDIKFSFWWLAYHVLLYAVVHGYGFVVYFTSNISLSKTGHYSFKEAVENMFEAGTVVDLSLFVVSFYPAVMSLMLATVTILNWPNMARLLTRLGDILILPKTVLVIQRNSRFFFDMVVIGTYALGVASTIAMSYMLRDNFGAMWPYACVYLYSLAGDALFVAIVTLIARAFRITINEHLSLGLNEELRGLDMYRKRYGELCNMVETTARCFSAWILITSGSLLVLLTCSIHFSIWIGQRDNTDGLMVQIAPVMVNFLRMIILCWTASRPEEEANRTTGVLAQIEGEIMCDRARPKVIHFNVEIMNSTKSLSAAGFFRVNAALILSVLGNVATYLVIFLQFSDFGGSIGSRGNTGRVFGS